MHLGTTRYKCAAEPEWLITLVPVLDFVFSLITNRMSRSLCLMPVPDISQSVWHQWKRFFPSNISSFIQSEWNSKFGLEKKWTFFLFSSGALKQFNNCIPVLFFPSLFFCVHLILCLGFLLKSLPWFNRQWSKHILQKDENIYSDTFLVNHMQFKI